MGDPTRCDGCGEHYCRCDEPEETEDQYCGRCGGCYDSGCAMHEERNPFNKKSGVHSKTRVLRRSPKG